MALRKAQLKEILSEAGCDAEKISDAVDKIIEGHVATVDALKEQISTLEKEAEQGRSIQKELDDLKQNNGDIASLREEYESYKKQVEAEKARSKKEEAFKAILKDCGVPEKHFPKILKYSDVDGVEFDEDGNVKEADTIRKTIKDEWSDHIEHSEIEGVKTANPPSNNGNKTTMTKEQIRAIPDASARQKAMMDNASLFGLES